MVLTGLEKKKMILKIKLFFSLVWLWSESRTIIKQIHLHGTRWALEWMQVEMKFVEKLLTQPCRNPLDKTHTHTMQESHITLESACKNSGDLYIYYKSRSHGRPFCFGSFFMLAVSIILCTYTQMYWLCTSQVSCKPFHLCMCCVCVCVYMGGWIGQKET